MAALSGEIYRALSDAREGGHELSAEQEAAIERYARLTGSGRENPSLVRREARSIHARLSGAGATKKEKG